MPHGGPDWGTEGPVSTIYSIQDLGELAARLGSPVTFDRRGNVITYDNFENGIEQWHRAGDVGYSIDWDGNYAKTGGFCVKLTTDNDENDACNIVKHIGFPVLSPIGGEYSYSLKQYWKYLDIEIWLADGSYQYVAGIRYDHPNTKLRYLDDTAVYQDVPGGSYSHPASPEQFDTLKFVADFTTAKYKRLLVNSQVFDLSAISFAKGGILLTPRMTLTIRLITNLDDKAIAYIDDVIITQNEP